MKHLEIFPGFSNKKQSACGLRKTKKLVITLASRIQSRLILHAYERRKTVLSFFGGLLMFLLLSRDENPPSLPRKKVSEKTVCKLY
jgi:hypothetical protein